MAVFNRTRRFRIIMILMGATEYVCTSGTYAGACATSDSTGKNVAREPTNRHCGGEGVHGLPALALPCG